ncbi:formate dehydrogenase, partial [Escherichia coli]
WLGMDVADYDKAEPDSSVGPFIMNPEGVARLFSIDKMNDGPFPEHYEPIESPIGTNPLHPDVVSSPVARIYNDDITNMGKADAFPYIATTYSITELFRHWTKHALLNAIVQPDQFIEIGEALASKKGIKAGDTVKVMSKRGFIKAKAVVTKRLQTLMIDGKQVDTIGIPCHWGFEGATRKGFLANTLTPSVGDANSQTPEYKAFLVNIERV